jgi:hypothetical protein
MNVSTTKRWVVRDMFECSNEIFLIWVRKALLVLSTQLSKAGKSHVDFSAGHKKTTKTVCFSGFKSTPVGIRTPNLLTHNSV